MITRFQPHHSTLAAELEARSVGGAKNTNLKIILIFKPKNHYLLQKNQNQGYSDHLWFTVTSSTVLKVLCFLYQRIVYVLLVL